MTREPKIEQPIERKVLEVGPAGLAAARRALEATQRDDHEPPPDLEENP